MGRLIYTAIMSLDGYIADESGDFSWAVPDDQVHAHVNALERGVGAHLYGRRTYELMRGWETMHVDDEQPSPGRDFAELWRSLDKVVYSSTLESVSTARTRLERVFDPEAVRRFKAGAGYDISIGGPALAVHAFRAGLVDEVCLYLQPVVVGAGKKGLPEGVRFGLELVDEVRFDGGAVHLRYRVAGQGRQRWA
ncbi:dihydrofolate reductase family protein [Saccharopolyspora taberi]|uniref:Dihydrofolate reductase family protein n=1 Tax=Saccharopolyspora taberi TaxID=60895 RepID=A0ABN3VD32_9PSEU